MIMESGDSQDLQGEWANWRPRRANSLATVQRPEVWRLRRSRYFSFGATAGKQAMFLFTRSETEEILSYSGKV